MFSLEVLLQTPNSASVSGENGKSLALDEMCMCCLSVCLSFSVSDRHSVHHSEVSIKPSILVIVGQSVVYISGRSICPQL